MFQQEKFHMYARFFKDLFSHGHVCLTNKLVSVFTNFTISQQVPELYREINTCVEHNFDTMVPIALATWQTNYNGESLRVPGILAESQVVQESLDIPGSDIRLMYHSSRANGLLLDNPTSTHPRCAP